MYSRTALLTHSIVSDIRTKTLQRTEPKLEHVQRAIRWVFRSQDEIDSDGSSAGFNLVLGWEQPYPETTGYIISTLYNAADYFRRTGNDVLADQCASRAERMALWLLDQQLPAGGFPAGTGKSTTEPSVFNTGQILLGLCEYSNRTTAAADVLEGIASACNWLVTVQNADGSWDTHDYNSVPHAYSSRISWPLLVCHEEAKLDDTVRDAAIRNLNWVLKQQTNNGWFQSAGFTADSTPYLHTIAYTVRGLLEAGLLLGDEKYVQAATTTASKLATLQSEGFLLGEYDSNWTGGNYHCLTGNAQMGIVWSRLLESRDAVEYRDALKDTTETLSSLQTWSENGCVDGALKGSHPIWGSYMYFRYPNWSTKFYIDLLLQYNRHIESL